MDSKTFFLIFGIAWASSLIPLIVYLLKARNAGREIRIIAALIVLSIVFNGLGYATGLLFRSSVISNNIYNILAFFVLSLFYREILFKMSYKILPLAGSLFFVLSFLAITFFVQNFFSAHQTYSWAMGNLVLVVYAIVYLHHLVVTLPADNLNKFGLLWINTAILLCHGVAIFIFLVNEYNFRNLPGETAILVWSLFNFTCIIQNLLFAIGMYFSAVKAPASEIHRQKIRPAKDKGALASEYATTVDKPGDGV